jgi:hypothetical protein
MSSLPIQNAPKDKLGTHLHHLQLLEPFLYQLLHLPRVCHALVLAEGISRPPLRVLAVVVGRELVALP